MATALGPGDILPFRRLRPLGSGAAVTIGANRKWAQVLVVTHPFVCEGCISYLASFEGMASEFTTEQSTVVAMVSTDWEDEPVLSDDTAPLPVSAVVDDRGIGDLLFPDETPGVVVADRFGQMFARFDAGAGHRFPAHTDVLATLLNIAISCPECGVPDVPCLTSLPEPGTISGGMRLGG